MKPLLRHKTISPFSKALLALLLCFTGTPLAQEFIWSPDLPVGSPLPEYGVPYPGIFLISSDGIIRAKFAEESYRDRPDFSDILAAAADLWCGS